MAAKKATQKKEETVPGPDEGRYSYDGLDRVMHEKARLGILASLASHKTGLSFNDLKDLCALTDGNLSRHMTVLSEANLVETLKSGSGARQLTMYRLTPAGRKRFADYISVLEQVVADAHTELKSQKRRGDLPGGWAPV
ncbi:MAG: transcriptional regulator [Planctomyces sp.]|nr:transcriptional regulator [Planctomyces sp.]